MKQLISILLTLSISVAALAQPQGAPGKGNKENLDKIRAEKVAFITTEVGLTPEEAQVFWPVYNEIEKQQKELMQAERKAYMALCKALDKGEGDTAALLDAYLKAKSANQNLHMANSGKYLKVLSVEKVARFYTCDEKFRRQQIGRLKGGHGGGRPGFGGPGGNHNRGERKGDAKGNVK
ncbi:MAG: hypothetical protein J5640_03845 [Bacteroidales bacterium]|nr:hypothetical protein [Bacteroidales bacterium]